MVNFPTWIPSSNSHSPALLDIFISSDISVSSTMVLSPLRKSGHIVASVSLDFLSNSKRDVLFHLIVYDFFCVHWDSLCDRLRDVSWEEIFKLKACLAANEFCEGVQGEIDVYILHCKHQVKPHSSQK